MSSETPSPSPIALGLLDLAQRRATGAVVIAGRRLSFHDGDVVAVQPDARDESLGEFLTKSGRVPEAKVKQATMAAAMDQTALEASLLERGLLTETDLHQVRRALWLDRLVRALTDLGLESEAPLVLEPEPPVVVSHPPVRTLPLVLDALTRCAADADAIAVGRRLNDRVRWHVGPLTEPAQRWAAFGQLPELPAVSTVLARNPAAAPHIAALVRAGLVTLASNASISAPRAREITLPPPPPKAATITEVANVTSTTQTGLIPPVKPPRLRLDPGADLGPVPIIERVPLRLFPSPTARQPNPLTALEDRANELEAQEAPPAERARAYCELAELYLSRLGAIEDAARAYREAAAALPSHVPALEQAARLCHTLGQHDVAVAYAEAVVSAASSSGERAVGMRLLAALRRAQGRTDGALEALCEAAAEDETNGEPHELVARTLAERGNVEGAAAHARLSASVWMKTQPARAQSLLAWIDDLAAPDPQRSQQRAHALLATDHPEAAVAVLMAAARWVQHADDRRALLLDAAQHAERMQRPDLAAEALTEAFDAEPHVDLVYEPLLADLAAAGLRAERAVIAEEIANACEGDAQAEWLTIAAEASVSTTRGAGWACWLLSRAVAADPRDNNTLRALRDLAQTQRDREWLADALEQAANANDADHAVASGLWRELGALADDQLGAPRRALRAWQQVTRLWPHDSHALSQLQRLGDKVRLQEGLLSAAEQELSTASTELRPKALRSLIGLLRDLPEDRARLAALHQQYLELAPDDEATTAHYEWLLLASGQHSELVTWLRQRSDSIFRGAERVRWLERLMLACSAQRDLRGVADAALSLLSLSPDHADAIARLERAALHLQDATLIRESLTRRAQVADDARRRGRALSALALLLERTGEVDAAVATADHALLTDSSAADAALLILRHAYRLPSERATASLEACRVPLGDSQTLLSTLARAASAAGDLQAQQRAVDAWCRLNPLDSDAQLLRLSLRMQGDNTHAIRQAAESCLSLDIVVPATATTIRAAISRLTALDAVDQAAELALHALSALGARDNRLVDHAIDLARRTDQPRLVTEALELKLSTQQATARAAVLAELADHHQRTGDGVGETHALVRRMAVVPSDADALDRTAALYAEQGDGERLLAALALGARHADISSTELCRRRLDMAAVAHEVLGDDQRALGYVRELVRELPEDRPALLSAMGALLSIFPDARIALQHALAIALDTEPRTGGNLCEWIAKTAEDALVEPALALELARRGLEAFPNQPGLLLLVERLALAHGDVEAASQTYEQLSAAAMGHHGRRAIHYRAGRWLERAGRPHQALREYVRAFDMSPGAGVAFRAIERVARETATPQPLVHAYETLAEVMRHGDVQNELWQRAAELCLDGANDHFHGFRLLLKSWRLTGDSALLERLIALGQSLRARDEDAARNLIKSLVTEMRERADKTWDAGLKVELWLETARVQNALLQDRDAAVASIAAATDISNGEDVGPELRARLHNARQQHGMPVDKPSAPDAAVAPSAPPVALPSQPAAVGEGAPVGAFGRTSRRVTPPIGSIPAPTDKPDTTSYKPLPPVAQRAAAGDPRRTTNSYARPRISSPPAGITSSIAVPRSGGTLPQAVVAPTTTDQVTPPTTETENAPTTATSATAPVSTPPQTPPDNTDKTAPAPVPTSEPDRQARLHAAVAAGDLDACEQLAELLAAEASHAAEAHSLLRSVVQREPWRTQPLRRLLPLSRQLGMSTETQALSELLSVFDASISAVTGPSTGTRQWPEDELHAVIDHPLQSEAMRVLAMTWEAVRAMPRFRRQLVGDDVTERDRVTPGVRHPVADAMLHAASVLRMEATPLYLQRREDPRVAVSATNPPRLIATTGSSELGGTLAFHLGSQLIRTRPELVLLSSLAADQGRTLVAAVNAAFGPAGGTTVSREAAQLASELWHSMPMRLQRAARDLLHTIGHSLDYDALVTTGTQVATRAGLVVASTPRHAVFSLANTDETCRPHDVTTESGFADAVRASTALQTVVAFSLSDAYLLARMRV